MRDRQRALAGSPVLVCGFKCLILHPALVLCLMDAPPGGIGADRQFGLAFAKQGLAVTITRVLGALVDRELHQSVGLPGHGLDPVPQPAGTDRLVLLRVPNRNQPRTTGFDGVQQSELLVGGCEGGLIMNHGHLRPELDPAVVDRGMQPGGRIRDASNTMGLEFVGESFRGGGGGACHNDLAAGVLGRY